MKWAQNYSAILFDFDGLLVNSEHLHFAAYLEMCKRRGYTLSWDFYKFCLVAHYSSTGLRDTVYQELPELKSNEPEWSVLYAEKKQIYQELIEHGNLELLPGVEKLLVFLQEQKIPRAVATNSTRQQVDAFKKHLSVLSTIPLWVTREDYKNPKPKPDAYLEAIQRLRMKTEDKLVGFEDSLRGIEALKKANVEPVLICPELHPQLDELSLKEIPHFTSFEEIPETIVNFSKSCQ